MASFGERVVGAMRLQASTFEEIEHDPNAMGQAVGVIVLAAVSAGLGRILSGGLSGIIFGVIGALIGYVVWTLLVWVIGTKVMPEPATKADLPETFRTIAFAASPGVFSILTFIPFLGVLIGLAISIWQIIAMVIAVRAVLDYTNTVKAVIVVVIGWFVYFLIALIMVGIMGASALMHGAMS